MGRSRRAAAPTTRAAQRGFALPLALAALVVVGALVAWSALLGLYAFRGGRNTIRLAQALASAEEGALLQVAEGDWRAHTQLSVGAAAGFTGSALADNGWYRGQVSRVSETLFLVAAEGFDPASRARQRVGLLVRLRPFHLDVRAVLDTRGITEIKARARVLGSDAPPSGWSCPGNRAPVAAVRVPAAEAALVSTATCIDDACLSGTPPILADEGPGGGSFEEARIAELARFATTILDGGQLQLRPEQSGGECDVSHPANWGDPSAPAGACGRYIPVVYSRGDLAIRGGRGQAFLVVDGDLEIGGDAALFGVILVRGKLVARGNARLRGAVVVANASDESTLLDEGATIGYSSCVVRRALAAAGVPSVLQQRGWLRLE